MKSARDAGLARSADSAAHAGSTRSAGSARTGPAQGLLDGLRHHLLAGETHYPDRPGMGELRRRVGAALPAAGFPAREPDGVLITAGEGESLFATLLGLGEGEGTSIAGKTGGRHQRLLDWMRVRVTEPGAEADPEAAFRLIEYEEGASVPEDGNAAHDPGLPQVHAIGSRLFAETDARARSASGTSGAVSSSAEGPRRRSVGSDRRPGRCHRDRLARWPRGNGGLLPRFRGRPSRHAAADRQMETGVVDLLARSLATGRALGARGTAHERPHEASGTRGFRLPAQG